MSDLPARLAAARADPALALLEGFHAVKHALRFGAAIERVVATDPAAVDALAAALAPDVRARLGALVEPIARERLRRALGHVPHTGVVAIARRRAVDAAAVLASDPADPRPLVLLEDPRHLGNVGAVVRVAAAADAAAVLTTGERDPWDPAALRGSAGLHYALPVVRVPAAALTRTARPLVAFDPDGAPLDGAALAALPSGAILAFGTERHGLSETLRARATRRLRIEMRPGVSSLNLATAVSAVLFAGRLCA